MKLRDFATYNKDGIINLKKITPQIIDTSVASTGKKEKHYINKLSKGTKYKDNFSNVYDKSGKKTLLEYLSEEEYLPKGLTKEMKEKIDSMTYEEMLDAWKNSSADDPMFRVPIGEYFATAMENKRLEQNESIQKRTIRFANGGLAIETEEGIKEIK